jgi:hypothetical protein
VIDREPLFYPSPQAALAVRGEGERGPDVLAFEVQEVREDLVLAHPAGQVVEHVGHRHLEAPDARLPAALARLDGDPSAIVHDLDATPAGAPQQATICWSDRAVALDAGNSAPPADPTASRPGGEEPIDGTLPRSRCCFRAPGP